MAFLSDDPTAQDYSLAAVQRFAVECLTAQIYIPVVLGLGAGEDIQARRGWRAITGRQLIIATGPGFTYPDGAA